MSAAEAGAGLLFAVAGTVVASVLSLVPALHIYNVAGFIVLGATMCESALSSAHLAMFFLGMATSYSVLSTIPGIFLSAPDDSMVFIVLPGQKYLMQRRGYEAAVLAGIGALGGVAALALLAPVAPRLFPALRAILQRHLHWILWAVIAYMLMSEWPKGSGRAPTGWQRWWDGWRSLTAGLVTFLLSGVLGFVLMYRSILPVTSAYQNLLPAFVGLFAVPWVLQNILARVELPPQFIPHSVDATPWLILRGTFAGVLGGLFAAFFPLVTGGIGGFIAGHATAQRDERLFIISQGASKVVYYVYRNSLTLAQTVPSVGNSKHDTRAWTSARTPLRLATGGRTSSVVSDSASSVVALEVPTTTPQHPGRFWVSLPTAHAALAPSLLTWQGCVAIPSYGRPVPGWSSLLARS